jgi:hypothetical protein
MDLVNIDHALQSGVDGPQGLVFMNTSGYDGYRSCPSIWIRCPPGTSVDEHETERQQTKGQLYWLQRQQFPHSELQMVGRDAFDKVQGQLSRGGSLSWGPCCTNASVRICQSLAVIAEDDLNTQLLIYT